MEPSCLALHRSGELEERARRALKLLEGPTCEVCPRLCSVDRLADERGLCRIGRRAVVASHFPHFGEEDCLRGWRGSGTIFFSGCNLRCVFCLPPDTLVATAQGPRPIQDLFDGSTSEVRIGDGLVRRPEGVRVYTLTGQLAPASKAFRHQYRGDLVRLKPLNAPAVRLTPNHAVFAAHRSDPERVTKVPAGSLTPEHYLVVPKRTPEVAAGNVDVAGVLAEHESGPVHTPARRVAESQLVSALTAPRSSREIGHELGYHPTNVRRLRAELRNGGLTARPSAVRTVRVEDGLVRFSGEHQPGIPTELPLDEQLSWLLGLHCAEGHVNGSSGRPNSYRLVISLSPDEEELVAQVSETLGRTFGVTPQVVKRVPSPMFAASEAAIRSFLDAYLAGDGTRTPTHLVANTVSPRLAAGLYELGLKLGVLPSIHRWVPPQHKVIEGRTVRQSPLWYVKFKRDRLNGSPSPRERTRWRDAGDHFLVPIHRIDREPYDGYVYNLEVDDPTHSYLAPAVAVSNCQNFDVSWEVQGREVSAEGLASMMLELQAHGCHNINWVTPEHVVPQILEALPIALERGLRLPIVYNTSAYDSPDSLELMDGVVDVYMPDLKLMSSDHARRYLGKREYSDVMTRNVREMHRQVGGLVLDERGLARRGLICRHLVMPGLLEETEAVLRWVAEELGPGTYVNLMGQYYPAGKVGKNGRYEEIDRRPEADELRSAFEIADSLGLRRLDPRSRRAALAGTG